jgi:hypothetical protein
MLRASSLHVRRLLASTACSSYSQLLFVSGVCHIECVVVNVCVIKFEIQCTKNFYLKTNFVIILTKLTFSVSNKNLSVSLTHHIQLVCYVIWSSTPSY